MLKQLANLLSHCLKSNIEIVPKNEVEFPTAKKFLLLEPNFLLLYDTKLDPKFLYHLKHFLQKFLNEYTTTAQDLQKFYILQKELKALLKSNERYLLEGSLEDFFSFLQNKNHRYALLENGRILLNHNLDRYTIEITQKKLKKVQTLLLPIKSGELYALRFNHYVFILQSETKIDEFYKEVIRSRLLWLDSLYRAKMGYAIDDLTGLFTRSKFLEDLPSFSKKYSFLFLNIKNFKIFNEVYTSTIGDRLLQEVAQRLSSLLPNMPAYRIYGDRFVLVAPQKSDILEQAQKYLKTKFSLYDPNANNSISYEPEFAFVLFENYTDEILEKSNFAFKKMQKESALFEKDIEPILHKESQTLTILQKALQNDLISPFYQKVVSQDEKSFYYEALMRIHYQHQFLAPTPFLMVAKEKGYYHQLNLAVIKKAMEFAKKSGIKVSLNIDIYDILQKDLFWQIQKLIDTIKIDPVLLQFEILETEDIYEYFDETSLLIHDLKALGCSIALDDFGKGYSNFSLLQDLHIDMLKIDMSLIKHIDSDPKSQKIVKAIIQIAKSLGIQTTAEGVSSEAIYKKVKTLGVDFLQGYFIAKPQALS